MTKKTREPKTRLDDTTDRVRRQTDELESMADELQRLQVRAQMGESDQIRRLELMVAKQELAIGRLRRTLYRIAKNGMLWGPLSAQQLSFLAREALVDDTRAANGEEDPLARESTQEKLIEGLTEAAKAAALYINSTDRELEDRKLSREEALKKFYQTMEVVDVLHQKHFGTKPVV